MNENETPPGTDGPTEFEKSWEDLTEQRHKATLPKSDWKEIGDVPLRTGPPKKLETAGEIKVRSAFQELILSGDVTFTIDCPKCGIETKGEITAEGDKIIVLCEKCHEWGTGFDKDTTIYMSSFTTDAMKESLTPIGKFTITPTDAKCD